MSSTNEIVENLNGFQICNYSSMGALTFTLYDIIISIEEEVREVWVRKPWTNLKRLYLALRFVSLGSQVVSTCITLSLPEPSTGTRTCRMLAGFQGVSSQILMMTVQVILMLRVQALFYNHPNLKYVLRGLFLVEVITMSTIFAIVIPKLQFGLYCVITSFPGTTAGFLVPPMLFEFLLFVLTMFKFYCAVREGWDQEQVISRFIKDGIWAFALPFTMLTINTCCTAILPGALSSVAYSWAIAIPGFAGCRLILNMNHLLQANNGSLLQSYTNHDVMDTIIFTNHVTTGLDTCELHDITQNSP